MGCLKIAHRANNEPVLRCVWNVEKQGKSCANLYDYGARFYDPVIGRFTTQDPLASDFASWTPYHYVHNNPIMLVDPTGMAASTHTDKDGNVLAVYDDGDLGVYKHEDAKTKEDIQNNYSEENTSAGGEKMGESLHSLSFANQSAYNENGTVKAANIKIDFGSTELTDKVSSILDSNPSMREYQSKAAGGNDWDIKSKVDNGSLLNGKYASPRDAGNFAAGAFAQSKGVLKGVIQYGYGAYDMAGNNKAKTAGIVSANGAITAVNPPVGITSAILIRAFGEDKLSRRSIKLGRKYYKENKKK